MLIDLYDFMESRPDIKVNGFLGAGIYNAQTLLPKKNIYIVTMSF